MKLGKRNPVVGVMAGVVALLVGAAALAIAWPTHDKEKIGGAVAPILVAMLTLPTNWRAMRAAQRAKAVNLARVRQILGFSGGGVHKRIDENRELLELLQKEAPELLAKHFWIEGWLASNDEFFVDLAGAVPIEQGRFLSATKIPGLCFPRAWPGRLPVSNVVVRDTRSDSDGR